MRHVFPIAKIGTLLALVPGASGQHLAGGHSGSFSGGYIGGFPGGGLHEVISAPRSFRSYSGIRPRGLGATPWMTWTTPHY